MSVKSVRQNTLIIKLGSALIAVAIFFSGLPLSTFAQEALDVDIKVVKSDGTSHDGTVTINNGDSWSYTWSSSVATACQLISPTGTSGITLAGSDGPIPSSHPWYPAVGSSTTLTFNCTDGTNTDTDSVTVSIESTPPPVASTTPSASITAINESGASFDGSMSISNGQTWSYSWASSNATACQLISPTGTSGITLAGTDGPIPSSHPWYPAVGSSTTLTFNCTDGTNTASDSVVISVTGPATTTNSIAVDIVINGEADDDVTITNGTSWNYTWTSSNATACQLISPTGTSGITLAGSDGPIPSSHPWYPAVGSSTTLTFNCTDGTNTASDSAVVRVSNPNDGGGGGGGGGGGSSSGGSSRPPATGSVTPGTVTVPDQAFCPYLVSYLRAGQANDVVQVVRLQAFLKTFEGHDYVQINGVFDAATDQAVRAFQTKYSSEILAPWGISQSTGYVYIRTLAKINNLVCGTPMPAFHYQAPAPVVHKHIDKEGGPVVTKEGGPVATTTAYIPLTGQQVPDKGQGEEEHKDMATKGGILAALGTFPTQSFEWVQCLYELLLILIVLYIIGSILENVLYEDKRENVRKKFMTLWGTVLTGSILAFIGTYFLGEYCLLLPLLIAAVATLVWILTYPKHKGLKKDGNSTPEVKTTQAVMVTGPSTSK